MMRRFLRLWLEKKAQRTRYHLRQFLLGCVLLCAGMLGMVLADRLMASSLLQELLALAFNAVAIAGLVYGLAHYLALLGGRLYRLLYTERHSRSRTP